MKRSIYNGLLRWKQENYGHCAMVIDGVRRGRKVAILLMSFLLLMIGCGKETTSGEEQTPPIDTMPVIPPVDTVPVIPPVDTVPVIEWIDLGLPSGLLWATCNVGANAPEENGGYYAWGETTTKAIYSWDTYLYSNGDYDKLTKYCSNAYYGYEGYTDTLTTLAACDDVAAAIWGDGARIPTKEEWQELLDYCSARWTHLHGEIGWLFYGSNGNTIFLPAVGFRFDDWDGNNGANGFYWSSSLNKQLPSSAYYYTFGCHGGSVETGRGRIEGYAIRPVRNVQPNSN